MAFLSINGWAVPVADGSARVSYEKLGAVGRSYMGRLLGTRRSKVRNWACDTTLTEAADALALESVINGDGQVWSFDNDLYSSKGVGPASGYSVVLAAVGGKYGGFATVGSGTSLVFNPLIGFVDWSVVVWKKTGATWDHYALTSTGLQYKNGAVHAPIAGDDITNWFQPLTGAFTLEGKDQSGAVAAGLYDDFGVFPYLMRPAQIAALYSLGAAHPSTPKVLISGEALNGPSLLSVYCIGEAGEAEFVQGVSTAGFQSNLHRLKFQLSEVVQAGLP